MEGWIKLSRSLKNHWIWKSENRLKWWIDILLTVNHQDAKCLIKGQLIDCKRGQSVRSLDSWAKDWNVSKGAVRDFFSLLQKDQMIHTESLQITTRITVCNYETYQDGLNAQETHRKRTGNAQETQRVHKQEREEGFNNENNEKITFDVFWNLYDKKVGKKEKLEKKWNNLKIEDQKKVIEHLPKYKISQPEKKYRKNPDTYLNNEGWNDEIISTKSEMKIEEKPKINTPKEWL